MAAPPAAPLSDDGLRRLVVKDGVHLGSLPALQLPWALGCVWAVVPARVMSEAEVNQALKAALGGAACWLDTDHVELRRWLVDAGWLVRDGYGRAYQRVPADSLPVALQPLAAEISALEIGDWVSRVRLQHQDQRKARHQAWQQRA